MLPLGGVPLPAEERFGTTGYDNTEVVDTINGDDSAIYDQISQSIDTINGDDSAIYDQISQLTILKEESLVTHYRQAKTLRPF